MKMSVKNVKVLKPDLTRVSEKSFGTILYTVKHDHVYFVVTEAVNGDFGFPKGHPEKNETTKQTALRETEEETGIKAVIVPEHTYTDEYIIKSVPVKKKQVTYYLAKFENQKLVAQPEEIRAVYLKQYDQAMEMLTFESSRNLLAKAYQDVLKVENRKQ